MTVKEWYRVFEEFFPAALSAEWDHDGIQCMTQPNRPVRRICCALDVTDDTVSYALDCQADIIVSHHPLLFRPLYSLTEDTMSARCLARLCEQGVALFSFHTRADVADGGVSDLLAHRLSLSDISPVAVEGSPYLRIGTLPKKMTPNELALHVKASLGADRVLLSAKENAPTISRVAVSGGEGGDFVAVARASGADAYVTGNVGYHRAMEASFDGMTVIEAGHGYSEKEITERFATLIEGVDKEVKTFICPTSFSRAI